MIASGQWSNMKVHNCPLTSIIKDQTAKSKITWNQVCVLARHTLWPFSLVSNIIISCLHVVMKKIWNFPKKSEPWFFILPVKINCVIFSAVSGVEEKNLQRSEQVHFLVLLEFALNATLRVLVLQFSPALLWPSLLAG